MISAARGLALFLGGFTVLNLAGDLRLGTNANVWWIDFAPLPLLATRLLLFAVGVALILWAVSTKRRSLTTILIAAAFIAAIANSVRFYVLLSRGDIASKLPIPLSLFIAIALAFILAAMRRSGETHRVAFAASFVAAAILFPLAQISLFGLTDYRRPADVIVVFGARAYASGTPSDTLADRVRAVCELYRAGLAKQLVFSGGPGEGEFDEPETMRRYARTLGVPNTAIVLDSKGINTESTVRNTFQFAPRILAVSDFYHLPRIKMTYQRYGVEVFTVPALTSVPWQMPFNLVREDAAFWAYYLRRFTAPRDVSAMASTSVSSTPRSSRP